VRCVCTSYLSDFGYKIKERTAHGAKGHAMMFKSFAKQYLTQIAILCTASLVVSAPVAAFGASSTAPAAPIVNADDPIAHYRAYEAAIAAGDMNAASAAAVTAWRTGERVWNGNNPNLPGLAYNAAWSLGLAGKIEQAREPARRAAAFSATNPDKVAPKEAAFLLAYANLMTAPTKANVEAYNVATRAVDQGGWGDFLLARSYSDGARTALNLKMPRIARDMVERGLAEVTRIAPESLVLRTNLLVLRTQSSLQMREFGQAVNEVMDARRAYGRPRSDRDTNWAALSAWEAASRAVYLSVYGNDGGPPTGSRIDNNRRPAQWTEEETTAISSQTPVCPKESLRRVGLGGPSGISFPTKESNDGYAGGALVRAQLDAEGRVTSTDILASLPRPSFGDAAVNGIKGWRYNLPANWPVECRFVDITLVYAFSG
jgi:TonB family protein